MPPTILRLSDPYGHVGLAAAGRGAPVVLVHGVGMQSAAWAPQAEALSGRFSIIALDMPGHGRSAPLVGRAELTDYVAWLRAVLDALGLGPVNLVGHSMGALIAGGLAIEHPELVARVALLNGVYRRSPAARAAVESRAAQIRGGSFDLETPLARWFDDSAGERAARGKVMGWLSEVDREAYAAAYEAFARGDATFADRFSRIACPLLAMTGGDDLNSTPEMSIAMASAARNGRAVVLPGRRHMINLTDPRAVNAELLRWLGTPVTRRQPA